MLVSVEWRARKEACVLAELGLCGAERLDVLDMCEVTSGAPKSTLRDMDNWCADVRMRNASACVISPHNAACVGYERERFEVDGRFYLFF